MSIPQNGQEGFKELESKKEWVRWVWPRRSRVIPTSSLREELWIGTFVPTFGLMECNLFEVSRLHEDCQQSTRYLETLLQSQSKGWLGWR